MILGNRRKRRQQYLLEVKVQTQGRLRRRLTAGLSVIAAVAVCGLTGYGLYRLAIWSADVLVFKNPRFAIAQIRVENDGGLTPQQIVQLAGVRAGQNLLALDLDQVRRNLEMVPLLRRVEVRRLLPNRLYVHVDERIALAQLQAASRDLSERTFFIDRSGIVMKSLKLADGTVYQPQHLGALPVFTGVTLADVRVGRPVESEQIYRALELLDKLEQSAANALMEPARIDLSKPHQLVLTTQQGTVVRFDVADFQQQLRRLGVILSWAQQRQKGVTSVDLAVSRAVPVTFVN